MEGDGTESESIYQVMIENKSIKSFKAMGMRSFLLLILYATSCKNQVNHEIYPSRLERQAVNGYSNVWQLRSFYYDASQNKILHGPFIDYSRGSLSTIAGYICGDQKPAKFKFYQNGIPSTVTIQADNAVEYIFSYSPNGIELGQLITHDGKPYDGIWLDWAIGVNGVKWSELLKFKRGKLIEKQVYDLQRELDDYWGGEK